MGHLFAASGSDYLPFTRLLALRSALSLLPDPKFSLDGQGIIHCQMVNKLSLLPIWL